MLVHARQRPEGLRFRLWSTVVDAYCCEPMEREAFAAWMRERADAEAAREIGERLDRAAANGTSAMWIGAAAESLTEWDTERCDGPRGCGGFHHAYVERKVNGPGALCSHCGEPSFDRAHGKPCR